jgi:hypothetical protein
MLGMSTDGASKDDAFQECADQCAFSAGILADATNTLINCLFEGVPDPLFADSGIDGGLVAACGDICFGYSEPGFQ